MGRKIIYKTEAEIEHIQESCLLVCRTLAEVGKHVKPGITTEELDKIAETFIRDHNAVPGFKGYRGFPATLCTSVNEEVVHGIPSSREIQDGDVVSIDCGVYLNDFYGDAAYTFAVGEVRPEAMQLLRVTKTSLYLAIEAARVGNRLGDIGFAIQQYCERDHRYSVVRELVGHGIGKALHEDPEVPNYGRRGRGQVLKDGLVIAVEPMINLGRKEVRTLKDGWTVISRDKKISAHYEHTIAVLQSGTRTLSNHSFIEDSIAANPEVQTVDALEEALS